MSKHTDENEEPSLYQTARLNQVKRARRYHRSHSPLATSAGFSVRTCSWQSSRMLEPEGGAFPILREHVAVRGRLSQTAAHILLRLRLLMSIRFRFSFLTHDSVVVDLREWHDSIKPHHGLRRHRMHSESTPMTSDVRRTTQF